MEAAATAEASPGPIRDQQQKCSVEIRFAVSILISFIRGLLHGERRLEDFKRKTVTCKMQQNNLITKPLSCTLTY